MKVEKMVQTKNVIWTKWYWAIGQNGILTKRYGQNGIKIGLLFYLNSTRPHLLSDNPYYFCLTRFSARGSGINEKNHSINETEAGLALEKDAMYYF